MIIPVRCFSCGKTIGDKYDYYLKESEALRKALESAEAAAPAPAAAVATTSGGAPKGAAAKPSTSAAAAAAPAIPGANLKGAEKHFETLKTGALLDALGLTRYCCRRHMLTTVDMMDVI